LLSRAKSSKIGEYDAKNQKRERCPYKRRNSVKERDPEKEDKKRHGLMNDHNHGPLDDCQKGERKESRLRNSSVLLNSRVFESYESLGGGEWVWWFVHRGLRGGWAKVKGISRAWPSV